MDWDLAKKIQHGALMRLVLVMRAMLGPVEGREDTVSRALSLSILAILRPTESALRRLVVVHTRGMTLSPRAERAGPNGAVPRGSGDRAPVFPLFDPRKRPGVRPRRRGKGPGPRIFCFDANDPPFEDEDDIEDMPVDAARLLRRLDAVQRALDDLNGQARRLLRWQEKRRAAGLMWRSPLRPGRPPGHRERTVHAVDEVLRECHRLALWSLVPPDTS